MDDFRLRRNVLPAKHPAKHAKKPTFDEKKIHGILGSPWALYLMRSEPKDPDQRYIWSDQ